MEIKFEAPEPTNSRTICVEGSEGVLKALEQEIKQVLDGWGDTEEVYPILTALYDSLPYGG